jgi:DsbC/DsbD-like thiol-disulfide interchange protein
MIGELQRGGSIRSKVAAGVLLVAALLSDGSGREARAQDPPIRFGLRAPGTELAPGGVLPLLVVAQVPRGWHLYGLKQPADGPIPTRIEVGPGPLFQLAAPVSASGAEAAFDPNFGQVVEWHDDSAAFRVPVRASRTALPGTYRAEVLVSYQRCNERLCLPLQTDTLALALSIAGRPEGDGKPEPTTSPADGADRSRTPAPATVPTRAIQVDSTGRVDTLNTTAPVPIEVPERPPEIPNEPAAQGGSGRAIVLAAAVIAAVLAGLLLRSRRR